MIALAGRPSPGCRSPPFRVAEPLLEIGPYELALSRREAEILLRASGVELGRDRARRPPPPHRGLGRRACDWPRWRVLEDGASRAGGRRPLHRRTTCGSEYLSRLEPRVLRFLRRTSVLERMCAPLCNAVLSSKGFGRGDLEEIERANLFLVQLDHHRGWYRYHHPLPRPPAA